MICLHTDSGVRASTLPVKYTSHLRARRPQVVEKPQERLAAHVTKGTAPLNLRNGIVRSQACQRAHDVMRRSLANERRRHRVAAHAVRVARTNRT
jgi:hypothetical protein